MSDTKSSKDTPVEKKASRVVLTEVETRFIQDAYHFLEKPSFLIRIANSVGRPLQSVMRFLPEKRKDQIQMASQKALHRGLLWMTSSMSKGPKHSFEKASLLSRSTSRRHSAAAFGAGAVGGFIGFASLPVELPITTGIILRSIASIADDFGLDLNDPEIQLECLYVLSLGSPRTEVDDSMDSAYWSSRLAFSQMVRDAARFMVGRTSQQIAQELQRKTAPVLVRFLAQVTMRFEGVVSQKVIAEMVPVIGALGGGAVNAAFADYFSQAARYHFGLRALEEKHGQPLIQKIFENVTELDAPEQKTHH